VLKGETHVLPKNTLLEVTDDDNGLLICEVMSGPLRGAFSVIHVQELIETPLLEALAEQSDEPKRTRGKTSHLD